MKPTAPQPPRWLDLYIGTSLAAVLVASVAATLIADPESLAEWLESKFRVLAALAVAHCVAMLVWMFWGGERSRVWDWLPPFCFFRPMVWLRWIIVMLLIGGTIAGIVGMHFTAGQTRQTDLPTRTP